jgi:hypothetical protein
VLHFLVGHCIYIYIGNIGIQPGVAAHPADAVGCQVLDPFDRIVYLPCFIVFPDKITLFFLIKIKIKINSNKILWVFESLTT